MELEYPTRQTIGAFLKCPERHFYKMSRPAHFLLLLPDHLSRRTMCIYDTDILHLHNLLISRKDYSRSTNISNPSRCGRPSQLLQSMLRIARKCKPQVLHFLADGPLKCCPFTAEVAIRPGDEGDLRAVIGAEPRSEKGKALAQ